MANRGLIRSIKYEQCCKDRYSSNRQKIAVGSQPDLKQGAASQKPTFHGDEGVITSSCFPCSGWKEGSFYVLLRTVFVAPKPAWKFLEEMKGRTSCPILQVKMPFENQENIQLSLLLCM